MVRHAGIQALARRDDPDTLPALHHAYRLETDALNRLAIGVARLRLRDGTALDPLISDIATLSEEGWNEWVDADQIAHAVALVGEEGLPILGLALDHPDAVVRWIVVMALGEMDQPEARRLLRQAADDPDRLVRDEARACLGAHLYPSSAVAALVRRVVERQHLNVPERLALPKG